MAGGGSYTIVEYFGGDDGYRCGYCKNEKGNFSHGMWSHTMTVQDYQDLIDRGWRRSGKYVYKPTMKQTCCPQHTIRCHALNFQPAKSHKKVLKKMSKFLTKGELPTGEGDDEPMDALCEEAGLRRSANKACQPQVEVVAVSETRKEEEKEKKKEEVVMVTGAPVDSEKSGQGDPSTTPDVRPPAANPKPGTGADLSRPPCRKAKDLRKERRLQKEQMKRATGGKGGDGSSTAPTPTTPPTPANLAHQQPKPLEAFLVHESLPESALHRLEVRLVAVNFEDARFAETFEQSAQLYARYQTTVHGDAANECNESEVPLLRLR